MTYQGKNFELVALREWMHKQQNNYICIFIQWYKIIVVVRSILDLNDNMMDKFYQTETKISCNIFFSGRIVAFCYVNEQAYMLFSLSFYFYHILFLFIFFCSLVL